MAKKAKTPKIVHCEVTGKPLEYRGWGRPPKYSPEVRKAREAETRRQRRAEKRAAYVAECEAAGIALSPRGRRPSQPHAAA